MAKPKEEKQDSPEYNALIEMTNDLCNALPIEDLLPKMITKRVIDFNDKSEIRSERTDRDKVQLFMSKLTGEMVSGENKRFYNFLDVMKGSSKCGFLVERMEGWISHYKFGTSPPIRAGQPVTHASQQSAAKFASQQSPGTVTRQQAKSSIDGHPIKDIKLIHKYVIPRISAYWETVLAYLEFSIADKRLINKTHRGLPRECCTALLDEWIESDKGVKPKTWEKFIEVLSEISSLAMATKEIKQCLHQEGVLGDQRPSQQPQQMMSHHSMPATFTQQPHPTVDVSIEKQLELQKEVFTICRQNIVKHLSPDDVVDQLVTERLIGNSAYEKLCLPKPTSEKNRIIVDELSRGGPGTFEKFCALLKKNCRTKHVADQLEREWGKLLQSSQTDSDQPHYSSLPVHTTATTMPQPIKTITTTSNEQGHIPFTSEQESHECSEGLKTVEVASPVSESKEGYYQSTGIALEQDEDSVMLSTVLLDNGIQYIRDNVGDQFSKDDMIAAITYCNMDATAALNHLFEKLAASDVSTPVNLHDPPNTQSAAVADKVQPSPTYQSDESSVHPPTTAIATINDTRTSDTTVITTGHNVIMTHDTVTTSDNDDTRAANAAMVYGSASVAPRVPHGPAMYDHVTVTPDHVTMSHGHVTAKSGNITSTTDSVHGNITASNIIVTDDDSLVTGKDSKRCMRLMQRYVIPKISEEWEAVAAFLEYSIDAKNDIKAAKNLPRECCRALLEDWVTTDNGVKPKTWRNLIEVLSEMEELEPVIEEIKQGLVSEGVTFNGTTSSSTTTTTITTDIKLDSHQAPVNRNDQYTVDDDDAGQRSWNQQPESTANQMAGNEMFDLPNHPSHCIPSNVLNEQEKPMGNVAPPSYSTPPYAFIVYAKEENDPYGEQVWYLSNLLNNSGIFCEVDVYHTKENIPDWGFWAKQYLQCHVFSHNSYVILVCSPTMIAKLEEKNDNGYVEMAAAYINTQILRQCLEKCADKFLPLCINHLSADYVPPSLAWKKCYHFPYDKLLKMPKDYSVPEILDHPDFASLRSLVGMLIVQQQIPPPDDGQDPVMQYAAGAPPTDAATT